MPLNTTVVDRDVEHPNRIQLTPIEGTTDTYDLTPVPGSVVQAGTPVNASLLNSAGIEVQTPAAGAITAPADADVLPVVQTATLKKITWGNIKATLKTYFDTLYAAVSHTHGNITNDGAIGSTTGLPVKTTTSGVLTVGTTNELVPTGAWTAWIPTITAATGTFTSASGAGRYIQLGKTVFFNVTITITTQGTGNYAQFSLPVTAKAAGVNIGSGRSKATGSMLQCFIIDSNADVAEVDTYDNANAAMSGVILIASGHYEAA